MKPASPIGFLWGMIVLLNMYGACSSCTFAEPFCRDPSCYRDAGER